MKRIRKLISVLLIITILLLSVSSLVGCQEKGELAILCTNDVHGSEVASDTSIGRAGVAALKTQLVGEGKGVLLVSAGDDIQGAPIVNLSKGETAVNYMNIAGYDFATPGNHEFDFGYDNLKALAEKAKFTILSASITDKATGKTVFEPYKIVKVAGYKIGIFGLSTPETLTKANPIYVEGLEFAQGEDLYKVAQNMVKTLERKNCDIIVCLGHLGIDEGSAPNRSIDVIDNAPGIDLFIDGHSHSVVNEKRNDTLLISTGSNLANIGQVSYDKENGLKSKLVAVGEVKELNEELVSTIYADQAEIDAEYDEVFAKTLVTLNGTRSGGEVKDGEGKVVATFDVGVRTGETNLGDFAADAILWASKNALGDTVDFSLTNGGGIRASQVAGNITRNDMITIFPFGNTVATVQLKGAQVLEILEAACSSCPTALGAFPQVSGITFTIDTTVEYVNGTQYPDSTYYAPANPGSRIKDVKIGGVALDLTKTYTMATNNFTAVGGDTYKVLASCDSYDTTVKLEDALINYILTQLNGTIGNDYATAKGRITIIK